MAKSVFEQTSIGSLQLENRVFKPSVVDSFSTKGHYSVEDCEHYIEVAQGQPGCILSGSVYVTEFGMREETRMMGLYDDSFIDEYKKLTDRIHQEGTKIVVQIYHTGSPKEVNSKEIIAPSAVKDPSTGAIPKEMTIEDIERIRNDFINAGIRAEKCGFDGVEVHVAHEFLLCEFLYFLHLLRIH